MQKPNKADYDFNDEWKLLEFANAMIKYCDYLKSLTEPKQSEEVDIKAMWKTYRDKQLETMGNSHLWNQREAYNNFKAGIEAASTTQRVTDEEIFKIAKEIAKNKIDTVLIAERIDKWLRDKQ